MTGCENSGFVPEHPVENQVPPLKAGVYGIGSVDVRPVAIRQVEPDFPFGLASVLAGKAVVMFTVRTDGKVADTAVVEADDVLFGDAAVAAIRKWRFRPAEVKGAPVDCRMTLPFVFISPYSSYPRDGSTPGPSNGSPPDSSHNTIEPR